MKVSVIYCCLVGALLATSVNSWPAAAHDTIGPTKPVPNFRKAKRLARDQVYIDHRTTIYCNCEFKPNKKGTSGKIGTKAGPFNPAGCGYEVRKSKTRGRRLEWEHIVPASIIGRELSCWKNGHATCETAKGKQFRGRKCCAKVNDDFEFAEADLHNLAPSVGELNADRSNHPYDLLTPIVEADETKTPQAIVKHRLYGSCNFEVAGQPKAAEPKPDIRGDVARIWFYMSRAHEFDLDQEVFDLLVKWHQTDPVGADDDTWEVERDRRIGKIQGNTNPYVHGLQPQFQDFIVQSEGVTSDEPLP